MSMNQAEVMDEDDEEVVFTNTALYEHLVSSGFSDFESASCLQQDVSQSAELTSQAQQKVASMREWLGSLLDWLGLRSGPLLAPAALSSLLDSGLMSDRDRAMAADLCSDQRQVTGPPAATDSFLVAAFVAAVAIAIYLPASCLLLSVALVLCAGGAAVARVRAAAGRRCVAELCRSAGELKRAGLRCCRLLQESHLMARGLTLSSGDAGAESAFTAQYGELVQAAGACLHAACAAYGRATRRLRRQQPLLDGVDPARHYVACDESALASFDENNFTVKDVKTLQQLLTECQSEFVRRSCLGLSGDLLPPDAGSPPPVPLALLSALGGTLAELQRRLSAAYRAHAALWTAEPEPVPAAAPPAAGLQRLYVSVHSVCLQAQVVALRARALEEALSAGDGEGAEQQTELHARLRRELTEIQQRLDSGQLFCQQSLLQLSRLDGGGGTDEQAPVPSSLTAAAPAATPVLLADLPEPELVDQFFEAVVEGSAGAGGDSEDELLSREDQLRRRLERDRARELLKELNVALTGKRQEWRVREALAKGEPVPPPPPPPPQRQGAEPQRTGPDSPRDADDPYKVNKADLYDFSGSEEEEGGEGWRPPGSGSRRGPPPDVTDEYRVDKHDLYRFSGSDGEGEPATPLVLPPAGDLTHLLPVQRRARPPARRPPSRPGSIAGAPRGETRTSPGQRDRQPGDSGGLPPGDSGGLPPLMADSGSPSVPGGTASTAAGPGDPAAPADNAAPAAPADNAAPAAPADNADPADNAAPAAPDTPPAVSAAPNALSTVPADLSAIPAAPSAPLLGPARYRAVALGLPSRQGFPAEMAAQAAALALRRRQQRSEDETFGDDGSDEDDEED